jgi:hypothetical protein
MTKQKLFIVFAEAAAEMAITCADPAARKWFAEQIVRLVTGQPLQGSLQKELEALAAEHGVKL